MQTEAQRRATEKYQARVMVSVKLKLNINTDADIISKLDSVPNMQGYVKALIRADIGGTANAST